MSRLYSFLLVFLQFLLIIILLSLNKSLFSNIFSIIVFIAGLSFGLYAIYCNKISNFNITPEIKDGAQLIKSGAYKYIRHPMYFALFLIMLSVIITDINFVNIFLYFLLIFVLYLKAKKEETLWIENSIEYEKYKKYTKMFIPFIL